MRTTGVWWGCICCASSCTCAQRVQEQVWVLCVGEGPKEQRQHGPCCWRCRCLLSARDRRVTLVTGTLVGCLPVTPAAAAVAAPGCTSPRFSGPVRRHIMLSTYLRGTSTLEGNQLRLLTVLIKPLLPLLPLPHPRHAPTPIATGFLAPSAATSCCPPTSKKSTWRAMHCQGP